MKISWQRLREPSTWAGISVLATLFGVSQESFTLVSNLVAGLAGVAAIVVPEKE